MKARSRFTVLRLHSNCRAIVCEFGYFPSEINARIASIRPSAACPYPGAQKSTSRFDAAFPLRFGETVGAFFLARTFFLINPQPTQPGNGLSPSFLFLCEVHR